MSEYVKYNVTDENGIRRSRGFTILVALFLMTSVYLLPFATSVSIGELLILVSITWLTVTRHRVKKFRDSALWLFAFYAVLISIVVPILSGVPVDGAISRLVRDGFYLIFIYVFGYTFLDYDVLKKWIRIVCTALSLLIIAQFVVYLLFGVLIHGILPGAIVAETSSLDGIYQHALVSAGRNGYLKVMGFLTEGAHCGQALAIGMVTVFNFVDPNQNTKKEYMTILLFSLAGILTFSASGLVLVLVVWMCIIWALIKSGLTSNKMGLLLIIIFGAISVLLFSSGDLSMWSVINRITSAASIDTADNSSFLRIYKGLAFWRGLPLEYKIFGMGFGNYSNLSFLASGISSDYLMSEYMNSVSYILVSGGIIGFLIYAMHIYRLFKKGNRAGKTIIVILLLMSVSSSPYSSVYWVWMVLIAIFNNRDSSNMSKEVSYNG